MYLLFFCFRNREGSGELVPNKRHEEGTVGIARRSRSSHNNHRESLRPCKRPSRCEYLFIHLTVPGRIGNLELRTRSENTVNNFRGNIISARILFPIFLLTVKIVDSCEFQSPWYEECVVFFGGEETFPVLFLQFPRCDS